LKACPFKGGGYVSDVVARLKFAKRVTRARGRCVVE